MKVLVTGAFGNIGASTVDELLAHGYTVRCFDLPTKHNKRYARQYKGKLDVVWGDLRNEEDVRRAVKDQDVIIHLAFIIPSLSATGVDCESKPDWAREINVGGTTNLIRAAQESPTPPRFIFSSSCHVYGDTQALLPPRTVNDPVSTEEHYSQHKITCEGLLRESGLTWCIVRFAASFPLSLTLDAAMYTIPLSNRMEYVHTRDVGLALSNALACDAVWGKTLNIGGGPQCQYYYHDIVEKILNACGIDMLPDAAFSDIPFPTDWLDTTESQHLLQYQRLTLDDYVKELSQRLGFKRTLAIWFKPIVRMVMLNRSPYYRNNTKGSTHAAVP